MDRVWLDQLGERPIRAIRYSELVTLSGNLAVAGKTLNNYLIPLRGVFEFARRDGAIDSNPAAADRERPGAEDPRPIHSPCLRSKRFSTTWPSGKTPRSSTTSRPPSSPASGPPNRLQLRWSDVDFGQRTVRVQRAVVRGQAKNSTKTYLVRDVELSDRAWATIEAQRAHTQLAGKEIFWNPGHRRTVG